MVGVTNPVNQSSQLKLGDHIYERIEHFPLDVQVGTIYEENWKLGHQSIEALLTVISSQVGVRQLVKKLGISKLRDWNMTVTPPPTNYSPVHSPKFI